MSHPYKERVAVYAASFDPITYGHVNVAERMAPRYDQLVLMVAVAPDKNYMFSPEERAEMVRAATTHIPNTSVEICKGEYVVHVAERLEGSVRNTGILRKSSGTGTLTVNHPMIGLLADPDVCTESGLP